MRIMMSFIFLLGIPALASSATLNVPGMYPTIQDAINASVNGDTVLVAPGTYVENIDFLGKAITVISEQGVDFTLIDGNEAGSVVTCETGEGPDTVLDGFTITNGVAYLSDGGGMRIYQSSPTVKKCTFFKNRAMGGHFVKSSGGGMAIFYGNPAVTNCTFYENSAKNDGGGINSEGGSPALTNCIFIGNSANGVGGGLSNYSGSNLAVTACIFSGNSATNGYGGGLSNFYGSSLTVIDCTFSENSAAAAGGIYSEGVSTTVTHCTFYGNSAKTDGGGMFNYFDSPTVSNCTFYSNSAGFSGGGMYNWNQSNPSVANCTFSGNSAGFNGGGMYNIKNCKTTMTNCVLWDDTPDEIYDDATCTTIVRHSDVQGGYPGTGNIDAVPLFADPANGDFHLTYPSPCKDTGDSAAVTELTDLEGDPRIAYGTVDMGADEFYTHLYWTGDATPGGNVEIKFVGLPGTAPVGLCIGTGVLDPPLPSMWGDWYLAFPIIGPIGLPPIPADGVYVLPGNIPGTPQLPYSIPMQALVGAELTNYCVLEVQ